jgi:hypothetical protein
MLQVLLFDVNIPAVLWLCFPIIGTWTGSEDKPESFDRGFQRLCRRLNWKSKDINRHPAQSVIIVRCDTFDIFINAIVEVLFTALVTDTDRNIVDNKQAFAPTPIQCNALLLHLSPAEGTSGTGSVEWDTTL